MGWAATLPAQLLSVLRCVEDAIVVPAFSTSLPGGLFAKYAKDGAPVAVVASTV
jgi:hypothetical protein